MSSKDNDASVDGRRRFVPLEGARNFRDIGGYQTTEGARIRYGQLYRSGHLAELSESDGDRFADLAIRLVFDLRTPDEVARQPSRFPDSAPPRVEPLPISPRAASDAERMLRDGKAWDLAAGGEFDARDADAMMQRFYRSFIVDHRESWSRILHRLADAEQRPALVHCAGGKDRTGTAVAILLLVLGVPRETVLADYQLSTRMVPHWIAQSGRGDPPEFVRTVMEARASYLEAALGAADELCGSFESYVLDALGIGESLQAKLRSAFLE